MTMSSSKGFSLVETIISLGILTTGVLGTAAVLTMGMQNLSSSPADVIVTQKAAEAVESVFSARDARKLTWTQINNTSVSGGIFLVGPQQLKEQGNDGLVNTSDDGDLEEILLPGKDQILGTADDTKVKLGGYTREIKIEDVPGENGQLRTITVTIKYKNGNTERKYILVTYLSAYS